MKKQVHPSDIVILVSTHAEGWKLLEYFDQQTSGALGVSHVFEKERDWNRHKLSFWMGDGRLKMSTIQSYKGWEAHNIIVLTTSDGFEPEISLEYGLYTALTRTRERLIVFNRHSKFRSYGARWPNDCR